MPTPEAGGTTTGTPDETVTELDLDDVVPPEPRRPPLRTTPTRRAKTDGAKAVDAVMATRGLLPGDDAELDRLRKALRQATQRRQDRDTERLATQATERARTVPIDKRLLERKLKRFNTTYDASSAAARARVDALAGRAMDDFAAGRFEAANRALNECLRRLKERP